MGSCPDTDFDLKFVVPMTGLVTSILENEKSAKLCRSLLRIPVIQVFGTTGNDSKVGRSVIFFQEEQIVLKRRA